MSAALPFDAVVIIVNYNGSDDLGRCLDALAMQTRPPRQVIVVDNASSDGSAEQVGTHLPAALLIRANRNLGFARANNLAAAHAVETRWLITLNPDAFPARDWLAHLEAATTRYSECAMFACRLLMAQEPTRLDGAGDSYHLSGYAWRRHHGATAIDHATAPREVFSPCGAAAMFRRDAFRRVGGFDENLFCYMEDVDLAFRLRLAGEHCMYLPDARVLHTGSGSTGYRSRFSTYHGHRNMVWVFLQNMPAALLWRYLPVFLLANVAALLVGARRGQLAVVAKAKFDALKQLRRCLARRRAVQSDRRISAIALIPALDRGWWPETRTWYTNPSSRSRP